jgi:hypothetical protein
MPEAWVKTLLKKARRSGVQCQSGPQVHSSHREVGTLLSTYPSMDVCI